MNPITTWMEHTDTRLGLMHRMLERFAADAGAMAASDVDPTFRTAVARCQTCSAEAECRQWLDSTGQAIKASSFCPNAETFERIMHGRPVDG